jgi:ribose transport system ATP-binding protein
MENQPENSTAYFVVEMKDIVKRFPGVNALDHVNFQLRPGEVHVLLGENGAGKSTLIKVLSGAYVADEGEILIDGKMVKINDPQDAIALGLKFIYQELSLVKTLDIARNMFLGLEPMRLAALGLVDEKTLYQQTEVYLERFHIDLDPREEVGLLSVTQQKMVEIARALTTNARVIVLDEPTDVLEDRSRQDLFKVISQLKQEQNVGFVYISHRYAEVPEIGDRVTILRDGKNVGTYTVQELGFNQTKSTTKDGDTQGAALNKMIELMVGGKLKKQYPDLKTPSSENSLQVEKLTRKGVLHDVSLTIKKGEIVGVTGLMGAGKTELGRAIAGVDHFDSGTIYVHGQKVQCTSPEQAIKHGIAYLPEDRKTLGLIQDHSLRNNYALPSLNRLSPNGLVQHGQIDLEIMDYIGELNIKAPDIFTAARQLSGGNQQKAVVAKWLGARSKVLIFDEPTRGIDINGKREIYRIMEELLEQGVGILMLTSDYTEALEMSHRIIVMLRGRICKEYKRGEPTESDILREAIGLVQENPAKNGREALLPIEAG